MTIIGGRFLHVMAYLFLLCMGRTTGNGSKSTTNSEVRCIESEKKALLEFKKGFNNPSSGLFSTWAVVEEEDCCRWRGVSYNNSTLHVISLNLSDNGQIGEHLSNSLLKLPYLNSLDLSHNNFLHAQILDFIGSLSHLKHLNLSNSNFRGRIPDHLGNLSSLHSLDLIPNAFGNMASLAVLDLSRNELSGSLDQILPQLSQLVVLHVARTLLEGMISETHLLNFSSLRVLDLSSNFGLKFNIKSTWILPFQLHTISLWNCQLRLRFPEWFRTQKGLFYLDISNASILYIVPHWFWNLSDKIYYIDFSSNQLSGKLPTDFSSKANLLTLYLSYNNFDGPLPYFSPSLVSLDLASNSFSGPISSICEMLVQNNAMSRLYLFNNVLSGEILNCWTLGKKLVSLNLNDNNLSSKIPNSIGHLVNLKVLSLSNNNLSGVVPSSLKNCSSLLLLNFMDNKLSRNIPKWIRVEVRSLIILDLGYNAFGGDIPAQLCQLKSLKALDLSYNNLSGAIPHCLDNLLALHNLEDVPHYVYEPDYYFGDGGNRIYISYNKLSGEIPRKITSLTRLLSLNLSCNRLNGTIKHLMVLDLSRNELSCTIPPTLSNFSSLESLNLSYNRLSGKIPKLNGSKNFDRSCFMENHMLCGYPLANNCSFNESYGDPNCREKERNEDNYVGSQEEDHESDNIVFLQIPAFYFSMGLGFIVGFWAFWGFLLVKNSWRHAYFRFLGNFYDQIFVLVVVYGTRLRRRFQNNYAAE